MNKNEFLRQLENLLSDLPTEERKEAMEYYVEYFEEAGADKEEDVIKELGSPKEVAHNIREELAEKGLIEREHQAEEKKKKGANGWQIACIVLLCIMASPLVLPIAFSVLMVAFALVITVAAILFSVVILVVAIVVVFAVLAVFLFFAGITKLFTAPLVAIFLIGISLISAGLFLLTVFVTAKLCGVVVPAFFRGLFHLIGMPFQKKEAK